jgi:hypothetical protein
MSVFQPFDKFHRFGGERHRFSHLVALGIQLHEERLGVRAELLALDTAVLGPKVKEVISELVL